MRQSLITTVKEILTLQEYCGGVINFKSYSKSYKMKKRIENPEENRAILLNVHETIIDRQTLEKVQALQKGMRRKKPTVIQEPSIFSGLLKCRGAAVTSILTSTRTTTTSSFSVAEITTLAIASAARRIISGWTFWSRSFCMRSSGWPASPANMKMTS